MQRFRFGHNREQMKVLIVESYVAIFVWPSVNNDSGLPGLYEPHEQFCNWYPYQGVMHQKFHSYQESDSVREKDKFIIVSVFLNSEGSKVSVTFERTVKTQDVGGNMNTSLEESIFIDDISAKNLGIFSSLISDWQSSRSRPAMTDSLEEISGVYERSATKTGPGRNSSDAEFNLEFTSLRIVLGTAGLVLLDPHGDDYIRFNIPASEASDKVPEYTNISKFGDFIFDFFDIEFEGSVEELEMDLPPEIVSSERLDSELQSRAVVEFESRHFQSSVRTAFTVLEERIRELGEYPETEYGTGLIQNAFHPENGQLVFGESPGEREGVMFLYRGAFQALRNPVSHRFIESVDEDYARDAIYTVNLLLRLLEENHEPHSEDST